ncbi:hypothetical protein ACX6XY_10890 [Streptomyces sp. O3]
MVAWKAALMNAIEEQKRKDLLWGMDKAAYIARNKNPEAVDELTPREQRKLLDACLVILMEENPVQLNTLIKKIRERK